MKKTLLDITDDIDDLPNNVIGISSAHKTFQVAWAINNSMGISLSKFKDIAIFKNKAESTSYFSIFSHSDDDEDNFFLLSNKDNGVNLYSKYKNIDYFFIVKSDYSSITQVYKKIQQTKFVIGCFIIPTNNTLKKIIRELIKK